MRRILYLGTVLGVLLGSSACRDDSEAKATPKKSEASKVVARDGQTLAAASRTVPVAAGAAQAFAVASTVTVGENEFLIDGEPGPMPDLVKALEAARAGATSLALVSDLAVQHRVLHTILASAGKAGYANIDLVVDGGAIPVPAPQDDPGEYKFHVFVSLVGFHHECLLAEGGHVRGRTSVKRGATPGSRDAYHFASLEDRARECQAAAGAGAVAVVSPLGDVPVDVVIATLDAVVGADCTLERNEAGAVSHSGDCLFPTRRLEITRPPKREALEPDPGIGPAGAPVEPEKPEPGPGPGPVPGPEPETAPEN